MDFNPYDPKLHDDPYSVYRRLRDEFPAHHNEEMNFWTFSRYDDVAAALRDPDLYISSKGIAVGLEIPGGDGEPPPVPLLIMLDGEEHTQLRGLVSGAFSPRRMAALEPAIRKVAGELLDELVASEQPDLVLQFSNPLPTIVIAELLGVPSADREQFKIWSNAIAQFDPAKPDGAHPSSESGPAVELAIYLGNVIEERRVSPRDDLLSRLLAAEVDGRKLTQPELIGFAFLLLVAGHETTTNLISNAAILLDQFPGERQKLIDDPSRIESGIEEFLRFDAPVQGLARTTSRAVKIHGVEIPEDNQVLLLFASANRDERRIENPDRFDVTRPPTDHLAFGFGKHFCLGSGLARLESKIAFEELLSRVPNYHLLDSNVERMCSGPIRGAVRLPIELGH
jgi:cytochrome P450